MLALASPLGGADVIASRVERLIDGPTARRLPLAARVLAWTAAAAVVWILFAGYTPLLQTVHGVSEVVAHAMP